MTVSAITRSPPWWIQATFFEWRFDQWRGFIPCLNSKGGGVEYCAKSSAFVFLFSWQLAMTERCFKQPPEGDFFPSDSKLYSFFFLNYILYQSRRNTLNSPWHPIKWASLCPCFYFHQLKALYYWVSSGSDSLWFFVLICVSDIHYRMVMNTELKILFKLFLMLLDSKCSLSLWENILFLNDQLAHEWNGKCPVTILSDLYSAHVCFSIQGLLALIKQMK